ncbi:MFS transporter [Anaerosporobacter sp.]|uniref:MFS transporter n=1 Tax=Anaerosporobacter sp. TaxID=1872529 RepID=UPI00286F117E|nr:MFS transporter [Anaerosporobacter sp.]
MIENIKKFVQSNPQRDFIAQFSWSTAFVFMTSGVFLSGLAVSIGASDVLIGYLTAIPNICGILILFFSSLIERATNRKKLAVLLSILSRLVTLLIVLIPQFQLGSLTVPVFVMVVITAFTLQAQTTVVINNWMVNFIDGKKRGQYISLRQTVSLVVTVILSLVVGRIVDNASQQYTGLLIVFGIAFLVSIVEVITLLRIPNASGGELLKVKYKLSDIIRTPMKNKPFLGFVLYVSLFYFWLYISDSFTVLYMMRYLGLPYATITGLQMLISLPQVLLLRVWGKLSDKRGHKFVLASSIWLFMGEGMFLALSNGGNYMLTISVAFLFAAAANSGFVVAVFNRRYELMPENGRILHDNFYSAAIGIAFILGPVVGGLIKDMVVSSSLGSVLEFGEIRVLYLVSMIGILLLQFGSILYRKRGKSGCDVSECM